MSMMKLFFYAIIGFSVFSSLKKYPSLLILIIPAIVIYIYFKKGSGFHGNGGILSSSKMYMRTTQSNHILSAAMELIKLNPTNKPEHSEKKQFLTIGQKRLYDLFTNSEKENTILHPEWNVSDEIYKKMHDLAEKRNYFDACMLLYQLINLVLTEMFKVLHLNYEDTPLNKMKSFHSILVKYVRIDYFDSKVKIYEEISRKSTFSIEDVLNLIDIYTILRHFDINLLLDPSKPSLEKHQFESLRNLLLINQLINPSLSSSKLIGPKPIQVPPQFNQVLREKVKQTIEEEEQNIRHELSETYDINNAILKLNKLNKEKLKFGEKSIKYVTEEQHRIGRALKASAFFFVGIAIFIILQIYSGTGLFGPSHIGSDFIVYLYQSIAFFILSFALYLMSRSYRGVVE